MFAFIKNLFKKKTCQKCVAYHALEKSERVKTMTVKNPNKKKVLQKPVNK